MDVCTLSKSVIAGDSLDQTFSLSAYPPADGWSLKFRLVPQDATAAAIDITADVSGASYRVQIAPATTATWSAGFYAWNAWVERVGERVTVSRGSLTIQPDPSALAPGHDARSDNRKAYDAIKAVLEKRATLDQERYMIDVHGSKRELWRTPIADLMKLLSFYASKVAAEEGRMGFSRAVKVYF